MMMLMMTMLFCMMLITKYDCYVENKCSNGCVIDKIMNIITTLTGP